MPFRAEHDILEQKSIQDRSTVSKATCAHNIAGFSRFVVAWCEYLRLQATALSSAYLVASADLYILI